MPVPGMSEEKDVKLLLKKLIESADEVYKFAVVARGPKDGQLILSKKEKLKKIEVHNEAEAEAKKESGGKAVRLDVITGECRLHKAGTTTLRLIVHGKAIAKAVACAEHLLARGPYKSVGFTDVILEEVEEEGGGDQAPVSGTSSPAVPSIPPVTPSPTSSGETKPENPATLFTHRLSALLPAIKSAVGTPHGDEAKLKTSEAGVFARKQDYAQANSVLDQVEELLKSSGGGSSTVDQAAIDKMRPEVELMIKNGLGDVAALKQGLEQLAGFVANQDGGGVDRTLESLKSQLHGEWERRLKILVPQVTKLLSTSFQQQKGDVNKIRDVLKFAEGRAQEGRLGGAVVSLTALEKLLAHANSEGATGEVDVIPRGKVAFMVEVLSQAKLRWDEGLREVRAELKKIQDGLGGFDPELAAALGEVIDGYQQELDQLLGEARKPDNDKDAQAWRDEARQHAAKLKAEVLQDDLIAFLDSYGGTTVKVQAKFAAALEKVENQLAVEA